MKLITTGLALLLSALTLVGCASLEPQTPPLAATGDLRLSGRLSVQATGSSGRAAGGNAGFELAGNPSAGQLELSTPLGSLMARARWGAGSVTLQTPDSERSFESLDELTRELLGEAIPVAALFDWLQGRPWPQAPSRALPGRTGGTSGTGSSDQAGFEQLSWRVDLTQREQGLIVATRLSDPPVILRARLNP